MQKNKRKKNWFFNIILGYIIEKVSEWRKLYNGDLFDTKGK